jgi:uncharacterized metal-binding protein YceD (DUF177 family)
MADRKDFPVFEVVVTTLPSSGFPLKLHPDPSQRAAIAHAAGISDLSEFAADIVLKRWRRDGVEISGELNARIEQPCVVTLEPVEQEIREDFRFTFLPERSALAKPLSGPDREIVLDPEGDDPPELFSGDTIDVWPVVFEVFSLAIDPFPRKPGAELPAPGATHSGSPEGETASPFAALKALKRDAE